MIFLSEYVEGEKIAQVYKHDSHYVVEIFQRLQSLGQCHFNSEESAENYAENWVQDK
jgi:hypothetical protein